MNTSRALGAAARRSLFVAAMLTGGVAAASAQVKPADTVKKAGPPTQSKTPPATPAKTTAPTTQNKTTAGATGQAKPPATAPQQNKAATPPASAGKAPVTAPQQNKTTAPTTGQAPAVTTPQQNKAGAPPAGQIKAPVTPPAGQTKAPVTPPVTPPQQTKGVAPNPQQGNAPRAGRGAAGLNVVRSDTAAAAPLVMMREVFEFNRDGRRDPFLSLLATTDLRPTLSDLKLLMTVVDEPGRSVALVQDAYEKKQKTVRVGSRLGRMRVTSIRADAVVFTIEEFGANRRDSLLLRDSTKARGR